MLGTWLSGGWQPRPLDWLPCRWHSQGEKPIVHALGWVIQLNPVPAYQSGTSDQKRSYYVEAGKDIKCINWSISDKPYKSVRRSQICRERVLGGDQANTGLPGMEPCGADDGCVTTWVPWHSLTVSADLLLRIRCSAENSRYLESRTRILSGACRSLPSPSSWEGQKGNQQVLCWILVPKLLLIL